MNPERGSRKERSRQAIAEAAIVLFEQKGFEGTTMDEIALKAGVSRPTVFNHFPHKEDILGVVGERIRSQVAEQISCLVKEGAFGDPLNAIRKILLAIAEAFAKTPNSTSAFHRLILQNGQKACFHGPIKEQREFIKLLLESAQKRGELRQDFTAQELVDQLMIGLFATTIRPWLNNPSTECSLEMRVNRYLDLSLEGFCPRST